MSNDAAPSETPSDIVRQLNGALMNSEGKDFNIRADFVLEIIARIAGLERENSTLRQTNNEWLAANGAHGWIDVLRAENAALERDAERYRARRETIFQTRLRLEVPASRNWRPTTRNEFEAEYDAACDKEVARKEKGNHG